MTCLGPKASKGWSQDSSQALVLHSWHFCVLETLFMKTGAKERAAAAWSQGDGEETGGKAPN